MSAEKENNMCGIVGYIGNDAAVPFLIEGLGKLEYRGYDSAGIAVLGDGKIDIVTEKGRLKNLSDMLAAMPEKTSTLGIGHTRWATHGEPDDVNAHPHRSESGLFAVVHNGIIENFAELKAELIAQGVEFLSETDTEVIPHLLEKNYDGDVVSAIIKTAAMLEGAYALGIICKEEPDRLFFTRSSGPLVLGKTDSAAYAASDVTAILKYTPDIYKLGDNEIAAAGRGSLTFYSPSGEVIEKESERIEWSVEDSEKNGYDHFMLKEIMEQPIAVANTLAGRISGKRIDLSELGLPDEYFRNIKKIFITACGSAYHVGLIAKHVFEGVARIPTEVDIASEFRYRDPIIDESTLVILISQSGETADTLAALRLAKERGAGTVSIVNAPFSSIANESDAVLYTKAGPEIAVATTKAYSAQLAAVYLLGEYIAYVRGAVDDGHMEKAAAALRSLPEKIQQTLDATAATAERLSELFIPMDHAYFIGRRLDYAACMEGSLKLKEISYVHSEAYAAGELKHGTISLIEPGTMLVALAADDELFAKTMSNIKEVKARGARVLLVTAKEHRESEKEVDYSMVIPDIQWPFIASLEVLPLQILAYYTAKKRGCDIDKPRNLAKSVTVE